MLYWERVDVTYSVNARADVVNDYTINLLKQIADSVGIESFRITSTIRTYEDQARAMYNNSRGDKNLEAQYRLYGPQGRAVLDAMQAAERAAEADDPNISDNDRRRLATVAMVAKMEELNYTSGHVASYENYSSRNVVDIPTSSIPEGLRQAFHEALRKAEEDGLVARYIDERNSNNCYHIEIIVPEEHRR
jgi:hypothetical protein